MILVKHAERPYYILKDTDTLFVKLGFSKQCSQTETRFIYERIIFMQNASIVF